MHREKTGLLLKNRRVGGFVLTLELMLIITILGIGLFVGFSALRIAIFKYYVNEQSREVTVSDAIETPLGKAIGFDEHEAPLVFYIDRSQEQNYRALIGVRDDRFTSREPVYYTQPNCAGDPCMKPPSSELMDNQGTDRVPGTGAVGYLYGLQGGPTYGIGRSPDGIPGYLYRQGVEACPVDDVTAAQGSRYISQLVEQGEPCDSPFPLPLSSGEPPRYCTGNAGSPTCPQTGPFACGQRGNSGKCGGCPTGYYDAGDFLNEKALEGQCCPDGTDATPSGIVGGLTGLGVTCSGAGLVKAVSVPDPNDPSRNALEAFVPPFKVNLPVDASSSDPDSWTYISPDGESGSQELESINN